MESESAVEISPEIAARIERNRLAARKKLHEKAAASSSSISNNNDQITSLEELISDSSSIEPQPPSKKFKTASKDEKYYQDLRNIASKGSVVRVHGTKLIDTGGGFLLEEKDLIEQVEAEKIIVKDAPPFIPTDAPFCEECNKDFSASFLMENFDCLVCDACRDTEEKHRFITRTDAKNEYLLKDVDLDKRKPILKFLLRPNPHNVRWGNMKLYLHPQGTLLYMHAKFPTQFVSDLEPKCAEINISIGKVEKRALEVWGSLEAIEKEVEEREEKRVTSKIKKYDKKMKSLRMSARSSLYTRDLSNHEHVWGPENYDEEEDMYSHKCTKCDQVETYEKM